MRIHYQQQLRIISCFLPLSRFHREDTRDTNWLPLKDQTNVMQIVYQFWSDPSFLRAYRSMKNGYVNSQVKLWRAFWWNRCFLWCESLRKTMLNLLRVIKAQHKGITRFFVQKLVISPKRDEAEQRVCGHFRHLTFVQTCHKSCEGFLNDTKIR